MPASRRRAPAPIDPRGRDHTTATAAELAQTAERGWDRLDRARKVPIERIAPNPDNPRTHYEGLGPLADSIAVRGLLLPLMIRADPARPGYYLVIAGSRRREVRNDFQLFDEFTAHDVRILSRGITRHVNSMSTL